MAHTTLFQGAHADRTEGRCAQEIVHTILLKGISAHRNVHTTLFERTCTHRIAHTTLFQGTCSFEQCRIRNSVYTCSFELCRVHSCVQVFLQTWFSEPVCLHYALGLRGACLLHVLLCVVSCLQGLQLDASTLILCVSCLQGLQRLVQHILHMTLPLCFRVLCHVFKACSASFNTSFT